MGSHNSVRPHPQPKSRISWNDPRSRLCLARADLRSFIHRFPTSTKMCTSSVPLTRARKDRRGSLSPVSHLKRAYATMDLTLRVSLLQEILGLRFMRSARSVFCVSAPLQSDTSVSNLPENTRVRKREPGTGIGPREGSPRVGPDQFGTTWHLGRRAAHRLGSHRTQDPLGVRRATRCPADSRGAFLARQARGSTIRAAVPTIHHRVGASGSRTGALREATPVGISGLRETPAAPAPRRRQTSQSRPLRESVA